jgi:hypothetical protein
MFKERLGTNLSPWSVYKTDHSSSFSTNAAIYMRQPGGSNYYVYWGDSSGKIFQMEGSAAGDAGSSAISTYRKSKVFGVLEKEDGSIFDPNKEPLRGRIYYRRVADADLLIDLEWVDDYSTPRCTVPLEGPPQGESAAYFGGEAYFGGSYYFNSGFSLSQRTSTKGFSAVGRGPGFYLSTTVQSSQEFDIMKIEV